MTRLSRRALLVSAVSAAGQIRHELFLRSPAPGIAIMAYAFYTKRRGGEMVSIEQRWTRSDTIDVAYIRRSHDNGRTWSAPTEMRTGERRPEGMLRRHPRAGFVDPHTGRYIEFWTEGILPTDDPLEGLRNWNIFYRVDGGGGRQVIHAGSDYNPGHPVPGVWTGKNCVMLGDMTCVPIAAPSGAILLPIQITPLGADGQLYNPTGGYTYTDAAMLEGRWRGDKLEWRMSDVIRGDPARSTRGMVEPTIEFLDGGRLLMVLRGSNDRRPELPSYRWVSLSEGGGHRWTTPQPWTYDTGDLFFSPSACSQLIRHSAGRLFWLGNITPENPSRQSPALSVCHRRSGPAQRIADALVDSDRRYASGGRRPDPVAIQLLRARRPENARDRGPHDAAVRASRRVVG